MSAALWSPLALVGALATAELAARVWLARRGYYVWTPWKRARMHVDRAALPSLEPAVRFEVNAEGERGDPLPRERSGLFRVLVAGGSAAEGYFLDQPSAWPQILQSLLDEPDAKSRLGARRVHVGNVARSLVPCEAIERILRAILPRYDRLDLILLMVGASDVVVWLEDGTPDTIGERATPLDELFDEHPERRYGWTPRALALREVFAHIRRRVARPVAVREHGGGRFVELRRRRREAREWIDSVPDPEPMLANYERHFRAALALARSKAERVIVVRQPWFEKAFTLEEEAAMWSFSVGRPHLGPTTRYYTHRVAFELLQKIDARTAQVCSELGIEQLDLMPLLERSLATYYDFFHFTPRGARAVAEHVARAVLRTWAPRAPAAAPRQPWTGSRSTSSTA